MYSGFSLAWRTAVDIYSPEGTLRENGEIPYISVYLWCECELQFASLYCLSKHPIFSE